jgi:hypothetical protein
MLYQAGYGHFLPAVGLVDRVYKSGSGILVHAFNINPSPIVGYISHDLRSSNLPCAFLIQYTNLLPVFIIIVSSFD